MRRWLALGLLLGLLGSCAPPPAPALPGQQPCWGEGCEAEARHLARWVGRHIQEVIGSWGVPDFVHNNPDGTSMVTYQTGEWRQTATGSAATLIKTRTFFVNAAGLVTRYAWSNRY